MKNYAWGLLIAVLVLNPLGAVPVSAQSPIEIQNLEVKLEFPDRLTFAAHIADQLAWGKRSVAHELTHVLIGHRTFSCLGSLPTWLNEGIAVYGEGGPDKLSLDRLSAAIAKDQLISLRALSGNFSEDPRKADLSYAQSYSVVNFLVASFGQAKLLKLFDHLRGGMKLEDSLNSAYGFGLDALEERWRAAVGVTPQQRAGTAPTTAPLSSPVPTYQPIAAAPLAVLPSAAPSARLAWPLPVPIWVILCGFALIVLGAVAVMLAMIARKRKST
jgi:Peptidase MA superfamily